MKPAAPGINNPYVNAGRRRVATMAIEIDAIRFALTLGLDPETCDLVREVQRRARIDPKDAAQWLALEVNRRYAENRRNAA